MRALTIGLAFLGVCVFVWGLNYKLSLYEPPHSISHHMPAAKLLTGKERVAVPALNLRQIAYQEALPGLLNTGFAALLVTPGPMLWREGGTGGYRIAGTRRLAGSARNTPSSVRPPPSFL